MNMLGNKKRLIAVVAAGTLLASPSIAIAGGYGSAGVADAEVKQYAAQSGIWCQSLEANIPESLFAEMDCNETGVARSAVAGERVTNTRTRGLFGLPAHEPRSRTEPQDDSAPSILVRSRQPTPTQVANSDSDSDSVPSPTPTTTGKVDKWDRLDQLGVNGDNWSQQSPDFYDAVNNHRGQENFDDDWSDFNLPN